MGIWVFGGSLYKINIVGESYNLVYIEDKHENPSFKYKPTDEKFIETLEIEVLNSQLTFMESIEFNIDNVLKRHLEFQTPKYYVNSMSNQTLTREEIFFKCEIREINEYPKGNYTAS